MDEQHFSGFLQTLYGAAAGPDEWSSVAPQLAALFGSGSGLARVVHRHSLAFNLASVTPNLRARAGLYEQYFQYRDPWAIFIKTHRNRTYLDRQMLPEGEWIRSEVYNDHAAKLGIHHCLGSAIDIDADTFGVVFIHRDRHQRPFSGADRRTFDRFMPHFRCAMQLRRQLGQVKLERDMSLAVLDSLDVAAFVVDSDCRVLFANEPALLLLAEIDGLSACHDMLCATGNSGECLLHLARVAAAAAVSHDVPEDGAVALRRRNGGTVSALVSPLPAHGAAALVLLRDRESHARPLPKDLIALFGFTTAEADIAAALCDGESLESISATRNVSLHTLRNQTKSVLAKAGVSRQAELVALITRSTAPRMRM